MGEEKTQKEVKLGTEQGAKLADKLPNNNEKLAQELKRFQSMAFQQQQQLEQMHQRIMMYENNFFLDRAQLLLTSIKTFHIVGEVSMEEKCIQEFDHLIFPIIDEEPDTEDIENESEVEE